MRYVVTGAGGSIGSRLCEKLIENHAEQLTLVSLTESGLYRIQRKLQSLGGKTKIVGVLGSAGDKGLMLDVCSGADSIIHAAAHKHVPICEANPITAIENNIRSTLNLIEVAKELKTKSFIFVSSDKAVRPASVMGATKRVCEGMISREIARSKDTRFKIVRFGNVLDSDGSVMPLWKKQIASGGPVTITDRRCERYFMSIDDACELILSVMKIPDPGTYVFDMGEPKRIIDLASSLIKESGKSCAIKSIGLRPGEKITEALNYGGEVFDTKYEKIKRVREYESPRMYFLYELLHQSNARHQDAINTLWKMVSWPKLFCLGIPKSGTCTIQGALEDNGFRVAHTSVALGATGKLLCDDHFAGNDPADRIPYNAIVHPSNCDPSKALNFWPQMDLSLLASLRRWYPDLVFCLNTRPVSHLVRSIKGWKDQQRRYTESKIPGLPKGKGNDRELVEWIEWHYERMRNFFKDDPNFIEIDIENGPDSSSKLSKALDIEIKEWPWLNRNTN